MASRRQERVSQRILREVADRLRDIKDPRLGFWTLAGCEVSPDLRHARINLSVWGSDETRELSLALVRRQAGPMRGQIARALSLRVAPMLDFVLDTTAEEAANVSRLIREARASDPNPDPLSPEEEARLREQVASSGISPVALRLSRQAAEARSAPGGLAAPAMSDAPDEDDIDDDDIDDGGIDDDDDPGDDDPDEDAADDDIDEDDMDGDDVDDDIDDDPGGDDPDDGR